MFVVTYFQIIFKFLEFSNDIPTFLNSDLSGYASFVSNQMKSSNLIKNSTVFWYSLVTFAKKTNLAIDSSYFPNNIGKAIFFPLVSATDLAHLFSTGSNIEAIQLRLKI